MNLVMIAIYVSCWFGCVCLGITLPLWPSVLKWTEKFVCPSGSHIYIETSGYKSTSGSQRSLTVYSQDEDGTQHEITLKAVAVLWGIFFVGSFPISIIAVYLISR